METQSGHIIVFFAGKKRKVWVTDVKNCKHYECLKPHNCHIHSAKGINYTDDRYMCLTNFHKGCPDFPKTKLKK